MRLKKREIPSYLFIVCLTIFYTLNWLDNEKDFLMLIGLFFGILAIILNYKFVIKDMFFLVIVSTFVIFRYAKMGDNQLPVLLIALFLGSMLEAYKVVNTLFYTKIFCVIIGILLSGYGKNAIAIQGVILILLYMCKVGEQADLKKRVAVIVAYLGIAIYTNTGAFIVVGGISVFLWIALKNNRIKKVCTSVIVIWIGPIFLFFNYFFAACVHEELIPFVGQYLPEWVNNYVLEIAAFLDTAMSMRLSLTRASLLRFGVSLLGGNVDAATLRAETGGYFYLDSGMINLLQGEGIILTILILLLYTITMYYLVRTEQYCCIIAGIAIILYVINEPILLSFGTNFLILFMGNAVYYFLHRKGMNSGNT